MKLLIPIDQPGSVAAGYEAPHSTLLTEWPVEAIPADVRRTIASRWNPRTGAISGAPELAYPLTDERIAEWLQDIHEQGAR